MACAEAIWRLKKHHLNYNDTSQNKINAVFSLNGLGSRVFHFPLGEGEDGGNSPVYNDS